MVVLRNLARKKLRTVLSVIGISVGSGTIIAFIALVDGHINSLNNYARSSGADLIVIQKNLPDPMESRISKEEVQEMKKIKGIADLSASFFFIISNPNLPLSMFFIFGRNPEDRFIQRYKNESLKGRLIEKENEVMLGVSAARVLGKDVGDEFELSDPIKKGDEDINLKFKIVGIYETPISWENSGCVVAGRVLQRLWNMGDAINIAFLFLTDPKNLEIVEREITSRLPNLKALRPNEFSIAFMRPLEYAKKLAFIISLISIIVGGVTCLNTMLMNVSERTREIGTLRAIGWSKGMIFRLIISEGLVLSVVGGSLGLLLGYVGTQLAIKWDTQGVLNAAYSPELFIKAVVITTIMGLIGSLYPARKASNLPPAEALRYE